MTKQTFWWTYSWINRKKQDIWWSSSQSIRTTIYVWSKVH